MRWASIDRLKIDFLFGFRKQVELFIRLSSVNSWAIPKSDIAIGTCRYESILHQLHELYFAFMTGSVFINTDNRSNQISFPQEQFAILWRTDHIAVFEFRKRSHIGQLYLTKLGNVSFQLHASESGGDSPKTNVTCSACSDPLFIELAEINSIDFLRKCFWLQDHLFLLPLPHCEQKVRVWAHRSQHISWTAECNTRKWSLCPFSNHSIKL